MKILERILCFLLCLLGATLLNLPVFSVLRQTVYNIVTVQPARELVLNSDNIITTFLGYDFIMKEIKPDIRLPFANYTLTNGIFRFKVLSSPTVRSGADGIVREIGYKDSKKYIEILHDGNIRTVYENVDVIGVNTNLKVRKGDIISTVKQDSELVFYVTYNDEILTDFIIDGGEIVWQR